MRRYNIQSIGLALCATALLAQDAAAQCPGTDDAFEDNDDCTTPWVLGAGVYPGLYVEKETLDQDFFQISVPHNNRVTVTINFLHAQADTDLRLFDLGCVNTLDSSASTSDVETVDYVNTSGGPIDVIVNVFVYSTAGNDCNNYDMDISVIPDPCITGGDDSLEDNDDCSTAISGITSEIDLFVSKTDLDYYAYTLADGDTLDAFAWFTHANADLDIILYDASSCGGGLGTGLAQGSSVDDNETLTYINATGGNQNVILEVNVWSNSNGDCNDYDLDVLINGGSGPIGQNYCGPANLNSSGQSGLIAAFGMDSAANNDVRLEASQVAANQFGMFVNSQSPGFVLPPGSQGNLCLSGGIGRHNADIKNSGATGFFSLQLDLTSVPTPGGPVAINPGETWYWQAWFRDNNPSSTSNFTDGIEILFN